MTINSQKFMPYISLVQLQQATRQLATRLGMDYAGLDPVFIITLEGAFRFAAELLPQLHMPYQPAFVKCASYSGTASTGSISLQLDVTVPVSGRHVVVLEDIVDTGHTAQFLTGLLAQRGAASVQLCSLLFKPGKYQGSTPPRYVGLPIDDAFVIGFGLDYNGQGRWLEGLYQLAE